MVHLTKSGSVRTLFPGIPAQGDPNAQEKSEEKTRDGADCLSACELPYEISGDAANTHADFHRRNSLPLALP